MIIRVAEKYLEEFLNGKEHKIFFLWGPRRSGKTTLLELLSERLNVPRFNFDLYSDQEKFTPDKQILAKLASACPIILIDEVQNYPQSTRALKILHDEFGVKIIATGSSELRQKSGDFDTLAGRFIEYHCLPLSLEEIRNHLAIKPYEETEILHSLDESLQIFGTYPEVFVHQGAEGEKIDTLQNMIDTYILKDIIAFYDLKNTKLAKDLLTKIALQIGHEVSLRELANSLSANVTTVANYLEIFVKNYILIPLPSFKTNLRRAISQHKKFYFLDLGIRNALIRDFRPLSLRPDKGTLFENFIISEIFKRIRNNRFHKTMYFYREYGGKEIDLILEDYKKQYHCYEMKYYAKKQQNIFPLPHAFSMIDSKNYFGIIQAIQN